MTVMERFIKNWKELEKESYELERKREALKILSISQGKDIEGRRIEVSFCPTRNDLFVRAWRSVNECSDEAIYLSVHQAKILNEILGQYLKNVDNEQHLEEENV